MPSETGFPGPFFSSFHGHLCGVSEHVQETDPEHDSGDEREAELQTPVR